MTRLVAAFFALTLMSWPAGAKARVPPVPENLLNKTAQVCVWINDAGTVTEASIMRSAGSPRADAEVLDWIRGVRWGRVKSGDKSRNHWLGIGLAFGDVPAPPSSETCSPPDTQL